MTLSIVIPSYARADLLHLCLQSVTTFAPLGTEILVVDDCSQDAIISRTAERFDDVCVLRMPKRSGFCIAANAGIAATTSEVVELLNDDTEVTAGWADAALRWFDDPKIAAVAPLVLQNDPVRHSLGLPPLIDSAGDEYDRGGFARKRDHGSVHTCQVPGPVWGVSASAGFYRRCALVNAGCFPHDFGAYFEDVDLSFRLRKQGHEIWHDPASVVWHRVSASYGKRPSRRVLELQSCNEERVFWRNVRGPDRVKLLPRHIAVLLGKAARRLSDGTFTPWFTGRLRAICS